MLLKGFRICHENVFSGSRVVTRAYKDIYDKANRSMSETFHCDYAKRLPAAWQTGKIHSYFSNIFPVMLHKFFLMHYRHGSNTAQLIL